MKWGFEIDKNDKPFYTVDLAKISYPNFEEITLPNSKKIQRPITREYQPDPIKKIPEEMGWRKQVTFETIVLLHVADKSEHYKIKPALFHRKYVVDAEKYAKHQGCTICQFNNIGSKFHYLRAMPQGIYHICWLNAVKHHRSASGPIQLHVDREGHIAKWVKLIEEKKITKQEAVRILQRLQKVPSVGVRMFLEGADMEQ